MTADNGFTLYVNGKLVGSGSDDWEKGQRFDLVSLDGTQNLFAVNATNEYNPLDPGNLGNAAGLLVAIQVNYEDGSSSLMTSDASWRTIPSDTFYGFEKTSLDDSISWIEVTTYGIYGTSPWFTGVSVPSS